MLSSRLTNVFHEEEREREKKKERKIRYYYYFNLRTRFSKVSIAEQGRESFAPRKSNVWHKWIVWQIVHT